MNPADTAVITLSATSDTMPLTRVQDLVNTRVALKLSQISGVGLVTLAGESARHPYPAESAGPGGT